VILAGKPHSRSRVRYTPKGTAIAKSDWPSTAPGKNEAGETKEEVTFVIDSFGRQAEVIAQYFLKGKPIFIEGRLRLDQWDDKQTGQKRSDWGSSLKASHSSIQRAVEGAAPADGAARSRPAAAAAPAS